MNVHLRSQDHRELMDNARDSVTAWGVALFGSIKEYRIWSLEPSKDFGGSRPSSMLDTFERTELLLLVLKQKYHTRHNPK